MSPRAPARRPRPARPPPGWHRAAPGAPTCPALPPGTRGAPRLWAQAGERGRGCVKVREEGGRGSLAALAEAFGAFGAQHAHGPSSLSQKHPPHHAPVLRSPAAPREWHRWARCAASATLASTQQQARKRADMKGEAARKLSGRGSWCWTSCETAEEEVGPDSWHGRRMQQQAFCNTISRGAPALQRMRTHREQRRAAIRGRRRDRPLAALQNAAAQRLPVQLLVAQHDVLEARGACAGGGAEGQRSSTREWMAGQVEHSRIGSRGGGGGSSQFEEREQAQQAGRAQLMAHTCHHLGRHHGGALHEDLQGHLSARRQT